jgi:hypothetical protein
MHNISLGIIYVKRKMILLRKIIINKTILFRINIPLMPEILDFLSTKVVQYK